MTIQSTRYESASRFDVGRSEAIAIAYVFKGIDVRTGIEGAWRVYVVQGEKLDEQDKAVKAQL